MDRESKGSIIVNSTIDLAHHLGLRAIAEGVEDLTLLSRLKALGCDAAQGYAISRPLKAEDLTRWLQMSGARFANGGVMPASVTAQRLRG